MQQGVGEGGREGRREREWKGAGADTLLCGKDQRKVLKCKYI